jgi:hypothetical protein
MSSRLESWLSFVVHDRRAAPRKHAVRRWHRGPARDARYLAWIRSLPCEICGANAEAAHTGSDGGMAIKAVDWTAVPLCGACHRTASGSYHRIGRRAFEAAHMIDFAAVVERLNAEYQRVQKAG